jgi:hypothetical protein
MAGSEPKVDRELLGRVAAMPRGQQRWLRTVLQSIFAMEEPRRRARVEPEERPRRRAPPAPEAERERRPRRPERRQAEPEPETERTPGLERLLAGETPGEEEYPELAEDIKGIADIADLLRESGQERRRFGEELRRLLESGASEEGEERGDEENGEGQDYA